MKFTSKLDNKETESSTLGALTSLESQPQWSESSTEQRTEGRLAVQQSMRKQLQIFAGATVRTDPPPTEPSDRTSPVTDYKA